MGRIISEGRKYPRQDSVPAGAFVFPLGASGDLAPIHGGVAAGRGLHHSQPKRQFLDARKRQMRVFFPPGSYDEFYDVPAGGSQCHLLLSGMRSLGKAIFAFLLNFSKSLYLRIPASSKA